MKAYNKFILPLNFLNYLYFTSFFQLFFITLVFRLYIYIMLVMLGCIRSTTSFLLLKYCKFSHFQNYIFIMNFYSIYHSKRGNLRQVAHFKQNNNYSKSRWKIALHFVIHTKVTIFEKKNKMKHYLRYLWRCQQLFHQRRPHHFALRRQSRQLLDRNANRCGRFAARQQRIHLEPPDRGRPKPLPMLCERYSRRPESYHLAGNHQLRVNPSYSTWPAKRLKRKKKKKKEPACS